MFAIACQKPGAKIEEVEMSIDDLWNERFNHLPRRKAKRRQVFYRAFPQLVRTVLAGKNYTLGSIQEAAKTEYWEFIRSYRNSWLKDPDSYKTRFEMMSRFLIAVGLIIDIQTRGVINPLELIVTKEGKCLYRGCQRLVIMKELGIPTARVKVVTL